jgi:tRNA(Ile)-lysidine synthase
LAERARAARYAVLREAARAAGLAHLLVGHHALDQIETVMIRVLGGSTNSGLAAMPLVTDDATPRLLRPLLAEDPAALRVFLAGAGVTWVEDPSNRDPNARRARLRHRMGGPDPSRTLLAAVSEAGVRRAANEARVAAILAERALVRPEGFAILSPGPIDPEALSRLVRTIGGERYPPPTAMIARLARSPRPATLAGVQLLPAGRLGPGWLILREAASLAPPVPAARGVVWDRRFRLVDEVPPTLSLGALGADAAAVRHLSPLPAAILRTLPALRCCNLLAVVPHLLYRDPVVGCDVRMVFHPPTPLAGAPFLPP